MNIPTFPVEAGQRYAFRATATYGHVLRDVRLVGSGPSVDGMFRILAVKRQPSAAPLLARSRKRRRGR